MKRILESINKVEGVIGSVVVNDEGEILSSIMPDLYDEELISQAVSHLSRAVVWADVNGRTIKTLNTTYENGYLVLYKLKDGFLYVVCLREVQFPLMAMTADLAVRKIDKMLNNGAANQIATMESERKATTVQQALSPEELASIQNQLTQELGPIAPVLLKRVIAKLGEQTSQFPLSRKRELIETLASHIGVREKQTRFLKFFFKEAR